MPGRRGYRMGPGEGYRGGGRWGRNKGWGMGVPLSLWSWREYEPSVELQLLRAQADMLKRQLEAIEARIKELESMK